MTKFMEALQVTLGASLPTIVGAIAVLIVGWLVAVAVRAGVRHALRFARLNDRVRSSSGGDVDVERVVSTASYYVLLLLVWVAFFEMLNLRLVSGPLQGVVGQVFEYLPRLGAGG